MKRFSAAVTLFAMIFTLCACNGASDKETPTDSVLVSGAYEYVLLSGGSAKITKYTSAEEIVTLDMPETLDGHTVSVIGEGAFAGVQNVTVVNAPRGLVTVEQEAFFQSGIRKMFMHTSVLTSIGARAFSQCPNLIQVDMPYTLKTIGDNAFAVCEQLVVAYFRSDVESIAGNAFDSCPSVKVYAVSNYANVIAYCAEHSLQTSITEAAVTTQFIPSHSW